MPSRALHRFAVATAVATFFLLIAGGMVTSTDSGLAVPDWPLSYGSWFPPMVGGIFYEHGHRMIAGLVGLMILGLAGWLRRAESRAWVRRLGTAALGAVAVQALLGGLTVVWLLPPAVSIAHACLGQAVFCVIVCVAIATGQRGEPRPPDEAVSFKAPAQGVAMLAGLQLLLGAVIRHTGRWVPVHIGGAIALTLAAAGLGWRLWRAPKAPGPLRRHMARLAGLLAVQLLAGVLVYLHRSAIGLRTVHVATGALLLAQAVVLAWEATRRAPRTAAAAADYFELTKPRLTALVLVTTAAGAWMAGAGGSLMRAIDAILGTWLVAGGANALNEWMERAYDAQMARTRTRPIPSGRVVPGAAWWFGAVLVALGLALLAVHVNGLAAALAALSASSYLLVYTPLKRRTALCTLVGAVPGALPPMIGWAAVRGEVGLGAWALFWLLFVWQLPHFLAIALLFKDDYARAGFRMLPVVEPEGRMTARQAVLYGLTLLPVSLFPAMIGLAGFWYVVGALGISLVFLTVTVRAAVVPSLSSAQLLFRSSIVYLPLVLLLLVGDRAFAMALQTRALRPPELAAPLPVFGALPDFSLLDAQGRPFTRRSMDGAVWVVDFIFTRCAGQCPMMAQRMAALQQELHDVPDLRLASISVDPSYDTPERLAAYAQGVQAGAHWIFLTGPEEAVVALSRDGFHLGAGTDATAQEPVMHSTRLVLVDRAGRIRGYYDAEESLAVQRVKQDARHLAAEAR